MVRDLLCLACKFHLVLTIANASHCKLMQVHARPGQMESQVDPGFQLASACNSVWPRVKILIQAITEVLACAYDSGILFL